MRTDADIFAAADAFNKRQLAGDLENTFSKSPADALASPSSTREALPDTKVTYPSGFWRQFAGLAWREFLSVTRNPYDVAARTITFCWVGAGGGQGGHAVLQRNVQATHQEHRSRLSLVADMPRSSTCVSQLLVLACS
jgi:hypothetical protein